MKPHDFIPWWLFDALLAFLPRRYRRRYERNPYSGALLSGILEAVAGFICFGLLFFQYLNNFGSASGSMMASPAAAGKNLYWTAFGIGVIGWFSFLLSPSTLLAIYATIEGVIRAITAAVAGEPLPSLPFWIVGAVHGWIDGQRGQRNLAPWAPDIIELGPPRCGYDFRVTSVRPKTEWNSMVQVEYKGELYHVVQRQQETVDGYFRYRYCLKKSPLIGAFRGIVKYDPTAPPPAERPQTRSAAQ